MTLEPAVEDAIKDIKKTFPKTEVNWTEDDQGGAHVTIESVPIDPNIFDQGETWVGFDLSFQLPYADVYPIHVRPDLSRRDGQGLKGDGLHPNQKFQGRPSFMLSRRSNNRDHEWDRPHLKVLRVLQWLTECLN